MTTAEHSVNGHKITVACWTGNRLNFEIAIDGEHYADGTSAIGTGDNEVTEAQYQARATAGEIKYGRLRRIDGEWRAISEEEFERGTNLALALFVVDRDEWEDDGAPETATEGTSWDFDGWNAVREHLRLYGYVQLGGDLYAIPLIA